MFFLEMRVGIIWRELSTEIQEGIFLQEDGENVGGGVSFSYN